MDQLSSCYFCGEALDVSLSEYPIIPKSLDPDPAAQGTVVLCSTCREKLGTIVEPVVEAATADASETESAEPPGLLDDAGTPTTDPSTTDSDVAPDDDGSLLGDDAADTDEQATSDLSEDEFEPHPASSSAQAGDSTAASADSETGEATADDHQAAEASGVESDAAEPDTQTTDGDDSTGPTLTKLEYNKVMRLLQNREMPVDRANIREVAVNAYDIDGEQFDTIIDAAVERDLIGQENGQLVEAN